MAKKETTEVMTVSPELQKNLDIILSLKNTVDEIGLNCMQIKITDETTLSVAQQNLSKANQIAKSIEEKRVQIKDPYFQAGKLIDKTCNNLVEVIEQGMNHIKSEIKTWEDNRKEAARKAQEELDRKLSEEKAAMEADEARKAEILDYINNKAIPNLKSIYESCDSAEKCVSSVQFIEKNFPYPARFEEYADQAMAAKQNYIDLINAKKAQFETADSLSDSEKELIKEKEQIALDKLKLAQREAELKAKEEQIRLEAERKLAEEAAEKEKQRLLAEEELNKTRNVKYLWKIELVDKSKLCQDWIAMDEAKVKAYLKANKDSLKDGEVVFGVKFFKESSITA
jgi:hypothetical protein